MHSRMSSTAARSKQLPPAAAAPAQGLLPEGLYRWESFQHLIPYSRETWRQRVLAGRAPRPTIQSRNCTAWKGGDLLAWLANPGGYKAPLEDQD